MNCTIKDKISGKVLTAEGIQYEYNFFETKKFMKEFGGDWTKGEVKDPNRVNEDDSPKIFFSSDKRNAFYKDASNNLLPVFNVKFQTLPANQRSEISNGMVEQLVVALFENKLDFTTKDIDEVLDVNFNIREWVYSEFQGWIKMGVTPEIRDSFIHSLDDYVELLIRRLNTIGLTYKPNEAVKQAASFQRNTKDKSTARIKFLLNTLVEDDVKFEFVSGTADNYLKKAVSQSKAWSVLLPILSDIPNLDGVNPMEQQLRRLHQSADAYPWLNDIIFMLEDAMENDPQTVREFFAAFNNIKNRINVTEIATSGSRKTFKTLNVEESNRDSKFISKEWMLEFKNKHKSKSTNQFKYFKNTVVAKAITDLHTIYKKPFKNNFEDRLQEVTEALGPVLEEIGATADDTVVSKALYFWKENSGNLHLSNADALLAFVGNLDKRLAKVTTADWKDDIFNKHLQEFAKAEEALRDDVGLHMATIAKNRVYLYSLPTMIQEKINEIKSGAIDIEEMQEEFPHLKGSKFLNAWKNKTVLKNTHTGLKGVVQLEGRSRDGRDGKSITKGDYIRTDFNNVLRVLDPPNGEAYFSPIYATQTPADKSREYQIATQVFEKVDNPEQAYENLYLGYFADEVEEMIKARNDIKIALEEQGVVLDQVLEEPELYEEEIREASKGLIKGYHLNNKGNMFVKGIFAGNAFKFGIIEDMNSLKYPIFKNGVLIIDDVKQAERHLRSNETKQIVRQAIVNDINAFKQRMDAVNIGAKVIGGQLVARNIDTTTFVYYKAEFPKKEGEKLEDYAVRLNNILALNYLTNSTMSKIEYSKIFTGNIQYYGKGSAYIKRVPATYIDGLQPMTGMEDGDQYFNQVTFKTESFKSILAEDGNLPEHIQNYYEYVDRTDAQGYITIDRWKNILEGIGKMGKNQVKVYNKIKKQWKEVEAGKPISEPLTAADIKVLSTQSLKGVYFENNLDEGPIYLKYSQAVLIPTLAATFPKIKQVADWMKKYDIDELVAETGVKAGAYKPIELYDSMDNLTKEVPTTRILDNRNWRLQQDLPTKLIKDNKIGVQIQKIIISRLAFLGDTDLGVGLTGQQMLDSIESTLSDLSDKGIEQFMETYGIDSDFTVNDIEKFYAPIIKDLEAKDNVSDNLIEALRSRVSLAALPTHARTVTSSFMGGIKKAAVDLLTPGGGFIQVSDQFIGKSALESTGTKMLVDFDGLKPPRVELREGRKVVRPGQILIPHSIIVKLIPDYQSMDIEELRYLITDEVREAIGYRIPTQARASVDALEIVGILPIEMGDSIITYGEITAKTGSDFDIDKLFVMLPELMTDEAGKLVKVPEFETRTRTDLETYIEETEVRSEQEVDIEGIQGIEKPTVVANFLKLSELLEKDDPIKAKETQEELKSKAQELEDLIKCLWS